MKGMPAGERGVAIPESFQADRTYGGFREIARPRQRQWLAEGSEKSIGGVLRRVTHQSEEGVNRSIR